MIGAFYFVAIATRGYTLRLFYWRVLQMERDFFTADLNWEAAVKEWIAWVELEMERVFPRLKGW